MPSASLIHSRPPIAAPLQPEVPGDSPMVGLFRQWAAQARHIQNKLRGDRQVDAGCDVQDDIAASMFDTPARDALDMAILAWVALVNICTNDRDNPALVAANSGFPGAAKFQEVAGAMFPELLAIAKGEAA